MDGINMGFDLHGLFSQMAGNVPVMAIVLMVIRGWVKARTKSDRETKEAISGIHDKLNRIEMKLAESGIADLKDNIEKLKESKTKLEMSVDAIWRSVEKTRRASDR